MNGDSIDMNNFQEVAATLYDLIEVTHFRVSNENDRMEVAAALYDLVESVHCNVSLIKIRNAIVECKGGVVRELLDETPNLVNMCIESSVKGNYPIHWSTVAISGSSGGEDDPLAPLTSVLQRETNVDRLNWNGASALHLISTQTTTEKRRFEVMAEVVDVVIVSLICL